jgi:uncharacterized protein YndB with AHSA1/START domain
MASFTIERTIAAPPEVVFDVLTDHRAYPRYTRLRKAVLEQEGSPDANGLGAIRRLHAVGPPIREEVIGFERPARFSYRVLSGLPVRDHVGEVTLGPAGGGTQMTYRIDVTPTVPVGGGLVVALMRQAVGGLVRGVTKESERRVAARA